MSGPRLRRLAADYESIRAELSGHQHVRVEPIGRQLPPEAYRVTFRVRGLLLDGDTPRIADEHTVEIELPLGYPRDKPRVRALTPIFHPNVRGEYCIQDYWAAGQSLLDTVSKIADMIQYRIYNPASPLDAVAARWATQNEHLLPLGDVSLGSPEVRISFGRPSVASTAAPDPEPVVCVPTPPGTASDEILLRGRDGS